MISGLITPRIVIKIEVILEISETFPPPRCEAPAENQCNVQFAENVNVLRQTFPPY